MKMLSGFYNLLTKELDAKYYPNVGYYHDHKATQKIYYACELFNNGCLTYNKFIERLAKASTDTKTAIHEIVSKYVQDFDGYEYDTTDVKKKFTYDGVQFRIVERDENYMGIQNILMSVTRVLGPNNGTLPINIQKGWTLKRIQEEAIAALEVFKAMGADIKHECTKQIES